MCVCLCLGVGGGAMSRQITMSPVHSGSYISLQRWLQIDIIYAIQVVLANV